ncbi:hypothetical protein EAW55_02165 [Legionella jordanis]|uniref:Transmembrane protein n=1 Tax=Legionella jordanis TaxID=456 RepID=A0A0W0VFN2_9GAMM|nr:EpsG family protein [Legionella jordanis]KTD18958.1 hypothetical protein Ljor_0181 [Legionella jordanis]RMX05479.1 hypothetical protein EAW55_02165 [Legionella jordanis]RMX19164.1 hypothetical protein EAS68_06930 [Legionella jordanis]VEH13058.1 Uncharacterised protein [Legionella jordanis]
MNYFNKRSRAEKEGDNFGGNTFKFDLFFLLSIAVLLIWAVGTRPSFVGIDTSGYEYYFVRIYNHLPVYINYEFLYKLFTWICTKLFSSYLYFFAAFACINTLLITVFVFKLSSLLQYKVQRSTLFFLLGIFFFLSPFFFSATVNVLRHGTAIFALFIFYISLISGFELFTLAIAVIFAIGFHHTAIISLAFSPLVFLPKRWLLLLVFGSATLYLTGLSEKLIQFGSLITHINVYEKIHDYGMKAVYKIGIRYNFTLFTLGMGLIFTALAKYVLNAEDRKLFMPLIKIYWVLSLPFFFFGFAAFADRYLLGAWLFLSVLATAFTALFLKTYTLSNRYYYALFLTSFAYLLFKLQGL